MEPRAWRWLPLFALVSCLLPLAASANPDALNDARQLLARIQAAAAGGNYHGTMMTVLSGGSSTSSRVGHYAVGDQSFEWLEALDGRKQHVLRHNDDVHTVWPSKRMALIEKRELLALSTATPQAVGPLALRHYALRFEGKGRLADREAVVFVLEPRDVLRYAQRLWADEASGLMLRADVIGFAMTPGAAPPLLESTRFIDIAIGVRPQPEQVLQQIRQLQKLGYRILRPQQQRTSLEAEGWGMSRRINGFDLAGCVRRGMDSAGDEQPVLQAVFTDGLTHVSLFIEPFHRDRHHTEMRAQQGATATLTLRRGEHWVTAVGDVPADTLKLFVDALERRRP